MCCRPTSFCGDCTTLSTALTRTMSWSTKQRRRRTSCWSNKKYAHQLAFDSIGMQERKNEVSKGEATQAKWENIHRERVEEHREWLQQYKRRDHQSKWRNQKTAVFFDQKAGNCLERIWANWMSPSRRTSRRRRRTWKRRSRSKRVSTRWRFWWMNWKRRSFKTKREYFRFPLFSLFSGHWGKRMKRSTIACCRSTSKASPSWRMILTFWTSNTTTWRRE